MDKRSLGVNLKPRVGLILDWTARLVTQVTRFVTRLATGLLASLLGQ